MSNLQAEQETVERLRYLADRLAGDRWLTDKDDTGKHLISNRSHEGMMIIASFHKDALPHEIELVEMGLDVARLLLSVGDRAGRKIAALRGELERERRKGNEKNYAANAAILTKDAVFWRFLEANTAGGPVRSATAADTRLKSVLNITSKNQLNEDADAARRWLDLRRAFENSKGQGQGRR